MEVDSEIFIYDHHYARMRPFQRIRTSAARDWAAFHFSNGKKTEYFLAVANEFSFDAGEFCLNAIQNSDGILVKETTNQCNFSWQEELQHRLHHL